MDNVKQADVSLFASGVTANNSQRVYSKTGLAAGPHKVEYVLKAGPGDLLIDCTKVLAEAVP